MSPDEEHAAASDGAGSGRGAGRHLPTAIISGVVLAATFIGALWWHPYAVLALVALLMTVAVGELDAALRRVGRRPATIAVLVAGAVMILGSHDFGGLAQVAGLAVVGLAALPIALVRSGPGRGLADAGATLLVACWVPLMASFVGLLLARDGGELLVVSIVGAVVINDIAAYAAGRTLGRRPLAPRVSPNKTVEGLLGSMVATVLAAALIIPALTGLSLSAALLLALAAVVVAPVGDLAESVVKRDLGVKDLGQIMPGHGGIMDRVDGILLVLPAAHVALLAVGA